MKRLLTLLVVLTLWSGSAVATEYETPNIQFVTDTSIVPTSGAVIYGNMEIQSPVDAVVSSPALRSQLDRGEQPSWTPLLFNLPQTINLQAGVPFVAAVEILCGDPTLPMYFDYDFEGTPHREVMYLLPALNWGVHTLSEFEKTAGLPETPDASFARPEPSIPEVAYLDTIGDEGGDHETTPAPQKNARTASGRFGYDRQFDWGSADGVTVLLYDQDPGPDQFIGSYVLGPSGNWSISYNWPYSEQPDLYVVYRLANSKVQVQFPQMGFEVVYEFSSGVKQNSSSSSASWGTQEPVSFEARQATHMMTQVTRGWRWLDIHGYGGIAPVQVEYPQSDWPHYKGSLDEIRIPSDSDWWWDDGMYWHEYGHHFVSQFGDTNPGGGYCQPGNRCDEPDGEGGMICRHCSWCKENANIAWSEGFASYISDAVSRFVEGAYEVYNGDPINAYNFESAGVCPTTANGTGDYDDPSTTEGALTALCRDLDDPDTGDMDDRANGIGGDTMSLGAKTILDIAAIQEPTTPWQFLNAYIAKHGGTHMQQIWSTAYNNGFNIDSTPPSSVGGSLASPSHPLFSDSADGTIEYTWNTPSDDISGIGGYSVWIGPTPLIPDTSLDVGEVNGLTTGLLGPGDYYFSIRAVDRAGNWSNSWSAYGPVTVRDPLPADLTALSNSSMSYPITPAASTGTTPIPTPLILNGASTYLNFQAHNSGETSTSGSPGVTVQLDGVNLHGERIWDFFPLSAGGYRTWTNKGPYQIDPGRHTLTLRLDSSESMAEADELDNVHARQWIWNAVGLTGPITISRDAPPTRFGGWDNVTPFSESNCDGYAVNASGEEFAGLVLRAFDNQDDYDLRSHPPSLNSLNGFSLFNSEALSYRNAGGLDAIFVRPEETNGNEWDFGVLNSNPPLRGRSPGDYEVVVVESVSIPTNTLQNLNLGAEKYLALYHFNVSRGVGTPMEIELQIDPAEGPLQLAFYDTSRDHMTLLDADETAVTDVDGRAVVYFSAAAGQHGIAVWRDPIDLPGGGPAASIDFTLLAGNQKPDLAVFTPSGWTAPLVPRHTADGTPSSVSFPTQLDGNVESTFLNAAFRNDSPATVTQVENQFLLDGAPLVLQLWPTIGGNVSAISNQNNAVTVRGGRHVTSMHVDPTASVVEKLESNNVYGRQWIWSPLPLVVDAPVTRLAPPDPIGGWEDVSSGTAYFNSDGFRTPLPTIAGDDGHWLAVATMPGAASDVDLRLHYTSSGTVQGFDQVLTLSNWEAGASDYVLMNFRSVLPREFDVGAIGVLGSEGFDLVTKASVHLDTDPVGTYGPFAMNNGQFLDLHEVYLNPGTVNIALFNVSGAADWGMTLHRAGLPYDRKTPILGAQSWTEPAGAAEWMTYEVVEAGYYCLATWKVGQPDLAQDASYELRFDSDATDVGPGVSTPKHTALTSVHPNPFNPQTVLQYVVRDAGPVNIDIFDLRGTRVRRLVDERRDSGSHSVIWNGRDDAGRNVASGVYVARLAAGAALSQKKLVLLK